LPARGISAISIKLDHHAGSSTLAAPGFKKPLPERFSKPAKPVL
jgi:hypothetical protein